jgi:hypothetical protein
MIKIAFGFLDQQYKKHYAQNHNVYESEISESIALTSCSTIGGTQFMVLIFFNQILGCFF